MSLGATLANAVSGLGAATKRAELISSNIANALTPSYAKRDLDVSARLSNHGGVLVNGISRATNEVILQEFRHINSFSTGADQLLSTMTAVSRLFGQQGESDTLASYLDTLREKTLEASSLPNDPQRLASVVKAAKGLAEKINSIAKGLSAQTSSLENQLNRDVEDLSRTLKSIEDLNRQIGRSTKNSGLRASLMDQRDLLLDKVSETVSFRVFQRGSDQIALYTTTGQPLLDGKVADIRVGHDPNNDGHAIFINDVVSKFPSSNDKGKLDQTLDLINTHLPESAARLDQFAFDLFSDLTGGPLGSQNNFDGVFDLGVNTTDPLGAAARISVQTDLIANPALLNDDPNAPAALLGNIYGALSIDNGINQTAAELVTEHDIKRVDAQTIKARVNAQHSAVNDAKQAFSVNSDEELQSLLLVQRSYAANARMIQVVNDLFDDLARI